MDEAVLDDVYGLNERAALDQLVNFVVPPLSGGSLALDNRDLEEVELVFSGWGIPPLTPELLGRLRSCRIIFHAGGTVRPFATPAMWNRDIRLTSAAEANAVPVAEFALASIIFSLKHAWQRILELRERGEYRRSDPTMPGAFGSTVGLLSLSRTGRQVAERLRGFDVKVIAYDPVINPAIARTLNVELCSLEEIFRRADVVSCHLPLLPETNEILGAAQFMGMKPGATFINTARGGVVRERELLEVLQRRADIFAVLDVVRTEPIPATARWLRLPNLVVTPHIAGSLGPECRRMGQFMIAEVQRYLAGERLLGEVLAADMAFIA